MHQKDKQRQSYMISNTQKLIKEYKANYQSALELCIQGLKIETSARDLTVASIISPYLLSLPSFVQVLKTETTSKNFEEIITQISLVMSYRHVPKNRMLMRMGDKGNEFFLILHGKVAFMVIKNIKCYLNEEEFISFLLKLRNNNELELLRVNILNNIKYFDINEDFDNWLRDCIYEYKTNELMNRKYSPELFEQMEKVYSNIDFYHNTSKNQTPKDKMSNLMVNPLLYIKMNSIENCNLDPKNRKLAIISIYQHMNSFVSGQNFGYIALESKNCKRTATVITLEDCDFGILTKEDYQKLIKDVNERARKQIYNLIYSYPLFHSIPKNYFENKYMHMFQYVKYRRGETIIKEGIQSPNIIFLKKGELELNIYKNIIEVNELIITLKKIKQKLQNQTHSLTEPFQLTEHNTSNSNIQLQTQMNNFYEYYEQKENEEFTLNNQFMSNEFKEIISKKMYIKISIIKDSDILGLFDTVLESKDISLFNCICLSSQGESYQIEMDCIMNIAQKEERVLTEAKRFSIKKITCFIERLNKHKEAVFNRIKECELTNQKLNKELFVNKSKNKNKSNEKNRFIDIERNSQYSQEQLFMKKINAKNNNLSTEKNDIKYNKNQFLQAPISNTNSRFIIKQKRVVFSTTLFLEPLVRIERTTY